MPTPSNPFAAFRFAFGRTPSRAVRRGLRAGNAFAAAEALEQRVLLTAAQLDVGVEANGTTITLGDGDLFGTALANLGDLDGDGVDDLAVGANGDDGDGGLSRGAVHVLFMNADGGVRSRQKIGDAQGGLTATLADSDAFGSSLASLGDLNGDGSLELAVGARGDDTGGSSRGAIYILSLNADGTVRSHQKISDSDGNFTALLNDSDTFGHSVARLGDLDGDGVTELAVGARGDDTGGTGRGAAYVLFLNADGTVKAHQKISSLDGGFTATLDDTDSFGTSAAGIGDLDGDGIVDLVVGAENDDDGGIARGAAYVLFLNADGTVKAHQKLSGLEGGLTATLDDGDFFGASLASLGDIDADGIVDLAVGATLDDDGGFAHGATYVLFLNADGTVKAHQKISDTEGGFTDPLADLDNFGSAVVSLGDLNGDGVTDLAVGARFDDGDGINRGAAYVLFLNADGTVGTHEKISDPQTLPAPLLSTFLLHSNAGARHTIYLDFNGHTTTGTNWNTNYTAGAAIVTPAFDPANDGATFNEMELIRIQRIWQRVAEDFIPFDVNVTTQDPGSAALIKSGTGDTLWGIRVVIGGSSLDWYGASVGGVAYYNSFSSSSGAPAFVFEDQLSNGGEKTVAEAASHEAGHSLNLRHDGRIVPDDEYYSGHGTGATGWAPIMGSGYNKELTQWSRGEYASAENPQDDLAVITTGNGFGYRADDHGGAIATATALAGTTTTIVGAGIIERNTDLDWFSFVTGAGSVSIDVSPFERGPNLDVLARLYDAAGALVATSNPLSTLEAAFDLTLAAGRYYLSIDGTGKGDPLTTGYSDYGSLGRYTITGTFVAPPPNVAPTADAGGPYTAAQSGSVTLTAAGSSDSDGVISGYDWDLDGDGQFDDATGVTVSFVSTVAGVYTVAVRVTDDRGAVSVDTALVTVSAPPTRFYVVNDASSDRTYEYGTSGTSVENYGLNSGNTAPRGAATAAAGDKVWVIDANKKVYVYNAAGALLGSWTANGLSTPEGIATDGTDVWVADRGSDKVFRYAGAASRLSGTATAASSFALNSQNKEAKGLEVAGGSLYLVNDSSTDKVFKYSIAGSLQGSWAIDAANKTPTGITLDPTNPGDIWIVDAGTDRVYRYANAASRTGGSQNAADSFALAAGNTNPQGIADPPVTQSSNGGATPTGSGVSGNSGKPGRTDAGASPASANLARGKTRPAALLTSPDKEAGPEVHGGRDVETLATPRAAIEAVLGEVLDALLAG